MKVSEYIKNKGLKQTAFMRHMGISTQVMTLIMKDIYDPRLSFVEEVKKYTEGWVTYKDWLSEENRNNLKKNKNKHQNGNDLEKQP